METHKGYDMIGLDVKLSKDLEKELTLDEAKQRDTIITRLISLVEKLNTISDTTDEIVEKLVGDNQDSVACAYGNSIFGLLEAAADKVDTIHYNVSKISSLLG